MPNAERGRDPFLQVCTYCGEKFPSPVDFCPGCGGTDFLRVGDVLETPWGTKGPRFEIKDIKKGGFGIIYMAKNLVSNRSIALKTLKGKYLQDRKTLRMFLQEAETWVKLEDHPNIVRAFSVVDIGGKPYVVMESVPQGNLRDLMIRRRLDLIESLSYAIQSCDGMAYVHNKDLGDGRKGVVHRDIKPENVMIGAAPDDMASALMATIPGRYNLVRITDFGLVKALDELVRGMAGTPEYMSPEQFFAGIPYTERIAVDFRSDIYSFGVVLYEMLTGKRPFEGPGLEEYAYQHMYQAPQPPRQINPAVPRELENIVLKCLEKNPDDRSQSFEALREELINIYNKLSPRSRWIRMDDVYEGQFRADTMYLYNKGFGLFSLGEYEDSIWYFDEVLKIEPRNVNAMVAKAAALFCLNRFREALECYNRALGIDPNHVGAWAGKGGCLVALGKPEEGERCLQRAFKLDPSLKERAEKISKRKYID